MMGKNLQNTSFLQSAEWEKLQNKMGRKTWEVGGFLIIQHRLPLGLNYLYCPRPLEVGNDFFEGVKRIAAQEKSVFFKIDPFFQLQNPNYKFRISNFIQPRKTVGIDLRSHPESLLADMHEKTRYNIRLAERKSVLVDSNSTALEEFWTMLQKTTERDHFHPHAKIYYDRLLRIRSDDFYNELFFAAYKGEKLASALINFHIPSNTVTYLHGASTREHKEVMAPYLLHWRIIQEAKKRGFGYYDFWGTDEIKWPGVTRFKRGFGGEVIEYPPSVDLVYQPIVYKFYQFIKKIRGAFLFFG